MKLKNILFIFSLFFITFLILKYNDKLKHVSLYINDHKYIYEFHKKISLKNNCNDTLIFINKSNLAENDILNYISNDTSINSQRLIIGLNDQYSIRYLIFRFSPFKLSFPNNNKINTNDIIKLNNIYKYGIGGLDIRPNILLQFNSFKNLNLFLDSLRLNLQKKIHFTNGKQNIIFTVKPFFFLDWDFNNTGLNYKIFSTYSDFNPSIGSLNILKLNIDGIFGPQVDYTFALEDSVDKISRNIKILNDNNKICFLKHFAYRSEYRFSLNTNFNDTHYDLVNVTTPLDKLKTQDFKVLDLLYKSNMNNGIMLGHHFLKNIDSNNIVSTSNYVKTIIDKNYINALTISDDLGMASYSKNFSDKNYYKTLITNLILISNYKDFDFKTLKNQSVFKAKKVIDSKIHSKKLFFIFQYFNNA